MSVAEARAAGRIALALPKQNRFRSYRVKCALAELLDALDREEAERKDTMALVEAMRRKAEGADESIFRLAAGFDETAEEGGHE